MKDNTCLAAAPTSTAWSPVSWTALYIWLFSHDEASTFSRPYSSPLMWFVSFICQHIYFAFYKHFIRNSRKLICIFKMNLYETTNVAILRRLKLRNLTLNYMCLWTSCLFVNMASCDSCTLHWYQIYYDELKTYWDDHWTVK